jgi:hypothetical protein
MLQPKLERDVHKSPQARRATRRRVAMSARELGKPRHEVIHMWLIDVLIVVVVLAAIYGFVMVTRQRTRWFSSHTTRRAEDLYPDYADTGEPEHRGWRRRRRT